MMDEPLTLQAVADVVGGAVEGDGSFVVRALAPLDEATEQDLTFADARHAGALSTSRAGAALVEPGRPPSASIPLVRVASVPEAVFRLLSHLAGPEDLPPAGIDPTATIAPDARIGQDVAVGPGVVIQPGAVIGDRSVLCAHVFVGRDVTIGQDAMLAEGAVVRWGGRIGDRVRIGSNSVIGYDGFGYQTVDGVHHRVPHVGHVVIEDDVELGACACVDRAKFGSTRIERGAKIDNLVQVAHNCRIGAGSILAAMVGVAGSAKLGRYCVIAGHVGIRDNITLGDGVQVGAYGAVLQDVPAGERMLGIPARPAREMIRIWQAEKRLPDLLRRVRELESRLKALESSKDH